MEFGDRYKLPFAWNTYAPNLFAKGPDTLLKLAEREARIMRDEFSVLTIPAPFVRQFDLSQGDTVFFDADGDSLRLKFLKLAAMADMADVTTAEQTEE